MNHMHTDGPLTPIRKLSVDLSSVSPARKLSVDLSLGKLHLDAPPDGALSYESSTSADANNDVASGSTAVAAEEVRRCAHCFTTQTPQWRRHTHGILLCNGCGLKARRKERRRERTRLADSTTSLFLSPAGSDFVQQFLLEHNNATMMTTTIDSTTTTTNLGGAVDMVATVVEPQM